ncbi:MAG: metal-dependent hydrolase [Candidatus Bathyarchaeia archaeon]
MPEPALHFAVIFALSAPRLRVGEAILLSLFALLPDLDITLYIHRSMSHSIIVLGALCLPTLLTAYILKRKYFKLGLLSFLAILSHPIMDCFQTYTPILYPITGKSLWVKVDGWITISSWSFRPQASIYIKETLTIFESLKSLDAPIFTSDGFILSLLLTIVPLLLALLETRGMRTNK